MRYVAFSFVVWRYEVWLGYMAVLHPDIVFVELQ